ncbi:MAG: hypothetical protein ACRC0S_01040 [Fusobacteriaceae bacterium]
MLDFVETPEYLAQTIKEDEYYEEDYRFDGDYPYEPEDSLYPEEHA